MIDAQIVKDILEYFGKEGGSYSSWYCGIASNPRDRLFTDHSVSEDNGWWIYKDANNETNARDTEQYLLGLGFSGGPGGGDGATKYVYAYKITTSTRE